MTIAYDRYIESSAILEILSDDTRISNRTGDIFVEQGLVSPEQLSRALLYQKINGGRIGWIMATLGYINRLDLCRVLAEHFHLPYSNDIPGIIQRINRNMASQMTAEEVTRYQAIPSHIINGALHVYTSEPEDVEMLSFMRSRFGFTDIKQTIVTDLDIMKICESVYRETIIDESVNGLYNRNAAESAKKVFTTPQIVVISLLLILTVCGVFLNWNVTLMVFLFIVQVFYFTSFVYKFSVTLWGLKKIKEDRKIAREAKSVNPKDLPVYTVLIAAYKEAKVMPTLIKAIKRFDYPEDKLDVILLLEENDPDTLEAAKLARPPASWRILTLPDSQPKTKPKALNYGVHFARGEYLTIYDAEDIPEPDQLKKAVAAFREGPDDVICVQAALNYFNENENFLTRMFTLEYTYWFDCLLPGLDALDLPIPLGGTSNHFDLRKLREIGAWDPYNVTEDADLGIRASARGYRVGVIRSTTYEEANSRLGNWLRQRSRWVKGYMQTFFIHNRHPFEAMKIMGMKQWLGYNLLIGGTPALFLLNPVMWAIFAYYLVNGTNMLDPNSVPLVLFWISTVNLIAGNLVTIFLNLIAVVPRKKYHLLPYVILSPVYWLLQSAGAYKALWQLIIKPSYWEKTSHGLSKVNVML